jgi:hypothetical protein
VIYKTLTSYNIDLSLSLYANRKELAAIIASYAFTMLGFLAAVIAILLNFSQSRSFKNYKKNKYLDVFFIIYFYCIITLALTFLSSLMSLSANSAQLFMRGALALSINSMAQVLIISLAIISICKKAIKG